MYVITGGAGFIGSNIAWALEQHAPGKIIVCDRLVEADKWRNIAKRELWDVVPPEGLFGFLEDNASNIEAVIHMGAISSTTEPDVDLIMDTNFRLSVDIWRWCTHHQVRLIYASSAATYGDGAEGFDDDASVEALAALRPLNAYGWSKNLFDRRVARMIADNEPRPPQWAGLKFFNVYGPNEYHKGSMRSVVSQVFPNARDGKAATLFKSHHPDFEDGGQLRDFVWVGDCVDIVEWLLASPDVNGLFNCGTGQARSFKDLTHAVFDAMGRQAKIDYIDTPEEIRAKYQYFTEAKMDRLRTAGYDKPFTSLEDGVAEYVNDFLNTDDPYR
ncbi:MAG: ADP-glyceromanno-heptose 6-epimerase [Rhodospirillales bacterium]|nr:ADP-glyceromanno-heptose 6-epimerase [Rhodospirillales bacterium]